MNRESYNFSFGDLIIADKGKNKFLESVYKIIYWNKIKRLINKFDKRGASADGQPPYSGLLLFKILLLQTWLNLSDHKVEEAINDRISFMKFLNLSLSSKVPDHSTICRFRNSLVKKKLDKKLFNEINN